MFGKWRLQYLTWSRSNLWSVALWSISLALYGQSTFKDKDGSIEQAHYGFIIKELGESGNIIKAHQNNKSFTPASVMKLVTTATLLSKRTPEFRYETQLSYSGKIVDSTLQGHIIIQGGGDPTLGSKEFFADPYEWFETGVEHITKSGIKEIDGSIIVDASVFDKRPVSGKWIWEDIGNYYGAGTYGLSCFDNAYHLFFRKTAIDEVAQVDSVSAYACDLQFESHVTGANNQKDEAYIYGSPWGLEKQIYGTIPAGEKTFHIKGALPNPPLTAARMFNFFLEKADIKVKQDAHVSWKKTTEPTRHIWTWHSPQLREIVRVTNKYSNNLYAEHLFKSLSASEESRQPASLSTSIDEVITFWKKQGLDTEGIKIHDGSGMSCANLLTPDFVVSLIDYMMESPYHADFYKSLAIAGVDGTFKSFLNGTELQGLVRGKSGTMFGVRCYAGIFEKSPSDKYSFCIMVNNFTSSSLGMKKNIENLLMETLR